MPLVSAGHPVAAAMSTLETKFHVHVPYVTSSSHADSHPPSASVSPSSVLNEPSISIGRRLSPLPKHTTPAPTTVGGSQRPVVGQ